MFSHVWGFGTSNSVSFCFALLSGYSIGVYWLLPLSSSTFSLHLSFNLNNGWLQEPDVDVLWINKRKNNYHERWPWKDQ